MKEHSIKVKISDVTDTYIALLFLVFFLFSLLGLRNPLLGIIIGIFASLLYSLMRKSELQSNINKLSEIQIDDLISNFIKINHYELKNGLNISQDKMKLIELIKIKLNYDMDLEKALDIIIKYKLNEYNYNAFETNMMSNNPNLYQDYITNYINIYYNNLSYTSLLVSLLDKNSVSYNENNINSDIISAIKKVEMKQFESRLLLGTRKYTISDVQFLSGKEFEIFLQQMFNNLGYQVENLRHTHDQGADLIMSKFGERIVVQAKRYSGNVGNSAIQEIVAAIKHYKASRGMVVTTSYFTPSAIELAKSNNIDLIDRDKLAELIDRI